MIECITTGQLDTNSYIISNEKKECVLIDPGLGYKDAAKYIKDKYIPKAIFITHAHIDHIDGIEYFLDLPIYIHKLDSDSLYDSEASLYDMFGRVCPYSIGDLNVHLLNDLDEIELIGYKFKILHTKGHTKGSICISFLNYVFSGDTLFMGSCGRTDFPTGSYTDILKSLNQIINYYPEDYIVYPGHGPKTTIKNEKLYNPYIRG